MIRNSIQLILLLLSLIWFPFVQILLYSLISKVQQLSLNVICVQVFYYFKRLCADLPNLSNCIGLVFMWYLISSIMIIQNIMQTIDHRFGIKVLWCVVNHGLMIRVLCLCLLCVWYFRTSPETKENFCMDLGILVSLTKFYTAATDITYTTTLGWLLLSTKEVEKLPLNYPNRAVLCLQWVSRSLVAGSGLTWTDKLI